MAITRRVITLDEGLQPTLVFGVNDEVLRWVQHYYERLSIHVRSNRIEIIADSVQTEKDAHDAQALFHQMIRVARSTPITLPMVRAMVDHMSVPSQQHAGTYEYYTQQSNNENTYNSSDYAGTRISTDTYQPSVNQLLTNTANTANGNNTSVSSSTSSITPNPMTTPKTNTAVGDKGHAKYTTSAVALPMITVASGESIYGKTANQRVYLHAIDTHTITFALGPAGTGKTYLAVAKAVQAFTEKKVSRIILTRPIVEAGERLGFLPGSMQEKVDPYLRPLYDALSDMLGTERMYKVIRDGSIEIAPLAYMRGQTLHDAFIILDEAQNTTQQQMKMFLTRLGSNSTMVITGDDTQIDITVPQSGLRTIEHILSGIDDIAFVHLSAGDVVRHTLVANIIQAYQDYFHPIDTKANSSIDAQPDVKRSTVDD